MSATSFAATAASIAVRVRQPPVTISGILRSDFCTATAKSMK